MFLMVFVLENEVYANIFALTEISPENYPVSYQRFLVFIFFTLT